MKRSGEVGVAIAKERQGVRVLGAWTRYGSIRACLFLEVLAAVSGRPTTSSEITAMVSLVISPTHPTSSGIQDPVIYINCWIQVKAFHTLRDRLHLPEQAPESVFVFAS